MRLPLQQLEAHLLGRSQHPPWQNGGTGLQELHSVSDVLQTPLRPVGKRGRRRDCRAGARKAVFRKRGERGFNVPDGSRWGDVKAEAADIGRTLTKAMKAVA